MTDDEVKQWLSDEERMRFEGAIADIVGTERNPVIAGLCRSLAETRRDLASLVDACTWLENRFDAEVPRPHRPDVPGHLRGAIAALRTFATMPRPR